MSLFKHSPATPERATLLEELELARTAQAVLAKQRGRVLGVMEALVQHIGFIRQCDLLPEEHEALAFAQAFLAARKGPGREVSVVEMQELKRP